MWSLSHRRRFWRTKWRGLAPSPSLIIPISDEELAEMEFVYKLAKYFDIEHVRQNI